MSKKRKTRKQKEVAHLRHIEQISNISAQMPTYTVPSVALKKEKKTVELEPKEVLTSSQKDMAYLKHDMVAISAASGIVLAFDVLLLVLLSSGIVHLNFLGY